MKNEDKALNANEMTDSDELPQRWSYVPVQGHWDETFRPSGLIRHHWREVAVTIGRMGFDELTQRWQRGQQIIQTNGVTYNVYGDPQGKERPWLLDPIPLVLDGLEWAHIERAISQRAHLLNRVLQDIYGPQRILLDGHLPPPLAFGNPNFLRPCCGVQPKGGVHLHLYAADLARAPNGDWWVIADRTQAPSGIGYALENRLVSARMLPGLFNLCTVRPLSRFFETLRDSLEYMAPNRRSSPRVVLMTPGPNNETYFEHSFLARHWGIPLVEGADLTVRDNRVFLKTLSGLSPVDMILRRTDDDFCDPLELRGDSLLGVAGLTQAARSGNVGIANALGSGLTETPALLSFLPMLCRQLLGEELLMPSVATWWCGHDAARQYVRENASRLVIKPAVRRLGQPAFPSTLDVAARQKLLQRMEAHPNEYVAQEQVALSTVPVQTTEALAPRHLILRVFAAWDGSGYTLMPGGLTRVSTEANSSMVSMQMGSGSKDTWVLGARTEPIRPRMETLPAPVKHGAPDLPSRVADNLFWLGRYAERVESGVRLVRSLVPSLSGEEDFGQSTTLETASQLLDALGYLPEEFATVPMAEQRWKLQQLLADMVYDSRRIASVSWNLKNVRRVTWPLKERLSQDTWRVLQQMERDLGNRPAVNAEPRLSAQMSVLDRLVVTLSAFTGLLADNTTRGHGWRFLEIGRRMERALQLADLFLATAATPAVVLEPMLALMLQIADSSISYRSRYHTALRLEYVLELLLFDEANPRSLCFQLAALDQYVRQLPGYDLPTDIPAPLALTDDMLKRGRGAADGRLTHRDTDGRLTDLEELVISLRAGLYDFSDALTARHLTLVTATRLNVN